MKRFMLCVLLIVPLSDCSQPVSQQKQTNDSLTSPSKRPPPWQFQKDALSLRMQDLSKLLANWEMVSVSREQRGFLSAKDTSTARWTLAPKTCVLWVALSSQNLANIEANLYSTEGDVLSRSGPGMSYPLVQTCSQRSAAQVYYQLSAREGAGAFLVAAFRGPEERMRTLLTSISQESTLSPDSTVERLHREHIREFSDALAKRHFYALTSPIRLQLRPKEPIVAPLSLHAFRCYTIAGFSVRPARQVKLRVIQEDGTLLASDMAASGRAAVQFCAKGTHEASVELESEDDTSAYDVITYEGHVGLVGGASALWLGTRGNDSPFGNAQQDLLTRHFENIELLGYSSPNDFARGELASGEAVVHSWNLRGGECARFFITSSSSLRHVRIRVHDAGGSLLSERFSQGSLSAAHICSDRQRQLDVIVTSLSGQGSYSIAISTRSIKGVWTEAMTAESLSRFLQTIDDDLLQGWQLTRPSNVEAGLLENAAPVEKYLVRISKNQHQTRSEALRWSFRAERGACIKVGVFGRPAHGIEAKLYRGRFSVARSVAPTPILFNCNDSRRDADFQFELRPEAAAYEGVLFAFSRNVSPKK